MDDLIYIILAIGWLAWTLYSNKVKQERKRAEQAEMQRRMQEKRAAEQQSPAPGPTYNMPENKIPPVIAQPGRSILEEIFGEEVIIKEEAEQEEYVPEIDERGWQAKMKEYTNVEQGSLEVIKEEVPSDYFEKQYAKRNSTVEQSVKSEIGKQQEEFLIDELMEEFDLKKALIYSEILRAPYVSGEC
ncbi:MAG TPA: hypothetical protein VK212_00960 [Lentimicrobium sp.]|nr:hypothetical protein [Lentimicrobium sp.]